MTTINLLPWREREREERKRQFMTNLVVVAVFAGLILLAGARYMVSRISNQTKRNQYLTQQIQFLDREIAEIRELQEQKKQLTERMAVIQDLQGKRPVIVRIFDELVRTLPEGVYYERVTRLGDSISVEGIAESNSRVTALMRSLGDSQWFDDPDFRQVTSEDGRPDRKSVV